MLIIYRLLCYLLIIIIANNIKISNKTRLYYLFIGLIVNYIKISNNTINTYFVYENNRCLFYMKIIILLMLSFVDYCCKRHKNIIFNTVLDVSYYILLIEIIINISMIAFINIIFPFWQRI